MTPLSQKIALPTKIAWEDITKCTIVKVNYMFFFQGFFPLKPVSNNFASFSDVPNIPGDDQKSDLFSLINQDKLNSLVNGGKVY